jgi:outer membrane protein TolC
MRTPALILTVMAATLLMAPASPQARVNLSRKDQAEESAKKVKELQKERIATLKQMADQTTKLFQHGSVSFEELCEARLLVLKAELDAAEKESDRITLYKNIVDVLKEYETWADGRFKSARGTMISVLKVKAKRLEAEINLERAKAKEAKKAK